MARGAGITSPPLPGVDHVHQQPHLLITCELVVCEEPLGARLQVEVGTSQQAQDDKPGHRHISLDPVSKSTLITCLDSSQELRVILAPYMLRQLLSQPGKDSAVQLLAKSYLKAFNLASAEFQHPHASLPVQAWAARGSDEIGANPAQWRHCPAAQYLESSLYPLVSSTEHCPMPSARYAGGAPTLGDTPACSRGRVMLREQARRPQHQGPQAHREEHVVVLPRQVDQQPHQRRA